MDKLFNKGVIMIVLAYDHRGYNLMKQIKKYLSANKLNYIEFCSKEYNMEDSYSVYAKEACKYMQSNASSKGIFSCGTGIGISIAANRYKGIRAGLCDNVETTRLARNDDDINVLVLAGNIINIDDAIPMINTFLNTKFEGGRHLARIQLLDSD